MTRPLPEVTLSLRNAEAVRRLESLRARKLSWAAISDELDGINKGLIYNVYHGKKRAPRKLLIALRIVRKPRPPRPPRPRLLRDMRREELARAIRERG